MALQSLAVPEARAWNGESHEALAREAVLYMLRSGRPELRLIGAILVGAGEGVSAGPGVSFRRPLAEEARFVDNYREVAARNEGSDLMGYLPTLSYSLDLGGILGASFASHNHFLLIDQQFPGQHDNYPGQYMREDASLDEGMLGEVLFLATTEELKNLCEEKVAEVLDDYVPDWLEVIAPAFGLYGAVLKAKEDLTAYLKSLCPMLVVDQEHSPVLSADLYRRNQSTATPADFADKPLGDVIWHPVDNLATAGLMMFQNGGSGHWLDNLFLDSAAIARVYHSTDANYLAAVASHCSAHDCRPPEELHLWSQHCTMNCLINGPTPIGPVLDERIDPSVYKDLAERCLAGSEPDCQFLAGASASSVGFTTKTFAVPNPFEGDTLYCQGMTCEFPADFRLPQAVPAGCARNAYPESGLHFHGSEDDLGSVPVQRCTEYFFGDRVVPVREWPNQCRPSNEVQAGNSCLDGLWGMLEAAGVQSASRGQLLHLGRLVHGLADVAQPGHVTNHLLGIEHTGEESFTDSMLYNRFENFQEQVVEVSEGYVGADGETGSHAVVLPDYEVSVSGDIVTAQYDLDYLLDVEALEASLGSFLEGDPDFFIRAEMSLEDLTEEIARRTSLLTQQMGQAGAVFLDRTPEGTTGEELQYSAEEVSRAFFGHAVLAEIAGLHRAVRNYLSEPVWNQAVSRVTWTSADTRILRDLGATVPYLSLSPGERTGEILSAFVDAEYQSKTFRGTCHVRTHAWCSENPTVGKPCGLVPDCAELGCDINNSAACAEEACAFRVQQGPDGRVALPFYDVPIVVRVSAENHSRLESDQFQATGTEAEGNMGTAYFRAPVNASAGRVLRLPAAARSVATWCTGSNVFEDDNLVLDENGQVVLVPSLVCRADIGLEPGHEANVCDPLERCIQQGKVMTAGRCVTIGVNQPDGLVLDGDDVPPVGDYVYPLLGVEDLADDYGTSAADLAEALAGADQATVEIVQDSPFGVATIAWTNTAGSTIVAIDPSGAISTTTVVPRVR